MRLRLRLKGSELDGVAVAGVVWRMSEEGRVELGLGGGVIVLRILLGSGLRTRTAKGYWGSFLLVRLLVLEVRRRRRVLRVGLANVGSLHPTRSQRHSTLAEHSSLHYATDPLSPLLGALHPVPPTRLGETTQRAADLLDDAVPFLA